MAKEVDAFVRNQTFDLVQRLPNKNVVGCKRLLKNKFSPNGSLGKDTINNKDVAIQRRCNLYMEPRNQIGNSFSCP